MADPNTVSVCPQIVTGIFALAGTASGILLNGAGGYFTRRRQFGEAIAAAVNILAETRERLDLLYFLFSGIERLFKSQIGRDRIYSILHSFNAFTSALPSNSEQTRAAFTQAIATITSRDPILAFRAQRAAQSIPVIETTQKALHDLDEAHDDANLFLIIRTALLQLSEGRRMTNEILDLLASGHSRKMKRKLNEYRRTEDGSETPSPRIVNAILAVVQDADKIMAENALIPPPPNSTVGSGGSTATRSS